MSKPFRFKAEDFIWDNQYGDAVMIVAKASADKANQLLDDHIASLPVIRMEDRFDTGTYKEICMHSVIENHGRFAVAKIWSLKKLEKEKE